MQVKDMEIIIHADAHIVELTGEKKDPCWKEKIELAVKHKKPLYLIIRNGYTPEQEILEYIRGVSWRCVYYTKNGKFDDCGDRIHNDLTIYKQAGGI